MLFTPFPLPTTSLWMEDMKRISISPLVLLAFLALIPIGHANLFYKLQVGAWSEDASIGNVGVSIQIQTRIYQVASNDFQYFWVGDILQNGAFIQFGYVYEPGAYCSKGALANGQYSCAGESTTLWNSDPRWMWQYWPNAYGSKDFSWQIGGINQLGPDMGWREYSIIADTNGSWDFMIDNQVIATLPNHYSPAKYAANFVAEKGSSSVTPIT